MKAGSSGGDKLPSMCSLLCSMKYQPNNQHSNGPVQGLLNLDAMVPFRRLLSAFCVLLAAYYWCQVYTTTLTSDLIAWLGEGSSWSFIGECRGLGGCLHAHNADAAPCSGAAV